MFALNGLNEQAYNIDSTDELYTLPKPILINSAIDTSERQQRNLVIDDFDLKQPIGYGSSAVVYSAVHIEHKKRVAVKIIDLDKFERNQIDSLRRETALMALSKHPHVLPVYGSFVHGSKLHIVTPYMAVGSCLDLLKLYYREGFDEVTIAAILKQALEGLTYLHKNGHIHRDVKAGNLLMDEDGLVMLADFGVSSSLMESGEKGVRKTFVGTPCWMAPEVMEQANYDYKADIWSFGITAIELATGQAPFAKYPPLKVLMLTLMNEPPALEDLTPQNKFSKVFKEMIASCLQKDPAERPSAEKLLLHPFFKQVKKPDWLAKNLIVNIPPIENRPFKKLPYKQDRAASMDEWDFGEENQQGLDHPSSRDCNNHFLHPNPPRRHISFGNVVIKKPTHTRQAASESWSTVRKRNTNDTYVAATISTIHAGSTVATYENGMLRGKESSEQELLPFQNKNIKHQHQHQSSAPPILMIEEPLKTVDKHARHGKQPSVHFVDEPTRPLCRAASKDDNKSPCYHSQQTSPSLTKDYVSLSRRSSNVSAGAETAKVGRFLVSNGTDPIYEVNSVQQSLSDMNAMGNTTRSEYNDPSNSVAPTYKENAISAVYRQLHQLLQQNDSQKQLITELLQCLQLKATEKSLSQAVNNSQASIEPSARIDALEQQLQAYQRENLLLQRENKIMRRQLDQLKNQ